MGDDARTAEISVQAERFLMDGAAAAGGAGTRVWRDRRGRPVLVDLGSLDLDALRQAGVPLLDLGTVARVYDGALERELAAYLLPLELIEISKRDGAAVDGLELPLGKVEQQQGSWLKLRPGLKQLGVNDRFEVVFREDAATAGDPTVGPVRGSANTIIAGRADRLVTRVKAAEAEADAAEARAWLRAFERLEGRKTLESRFACAGIQYVQRGNVPYLYRTSQLNFFAPDDEEMAAIRREVEARFATVGRRVPGVEILSLTGLPRSAAEYDALLDRLKARGESAEALGLPPALDRSRFHDPRAGGVVSSNFVHFASLKEIPDTLRIITVNTDYHGEVKSRGVLSPLMAIMSLIGVISAHAGAAVLNRRGQATTFTGPTGTGKTTACSFWSERNEGYRREELARRYAADFGRERPGAGADGEVARIMETVGVLCQEDWIEIHRRDDARWVFWPTERTMYARTGGFPGLRFILAENEPLIENACADFGGGGDSWTLGRVTHEYFPERLFYDPVWGHLKYDRTVRPVGANVFLERNKALSFMVKRVEPDEAIRWLLIGRTPAGKFEPLYNAYPDFSGLLMTRKVVGEALVEAYARAEQDGDHGPIGGGDADLGRAIFEKLHVQVTLWRRHCTEVKTYIVNGGPGLEITQDANWLLSEHPEVFDREPEMSVDRFKAYMEEMYGVTYGARGEWTHVARPARRR